jgi:hypothetical protein
VELGWVPARRTAEVIDLAVEGMTVEVNGYDTFEETNVWFRFSGSPTMRSPPRATASMPTPPA